MIKEILLFHCPANKDKKSKPRKIAISAELIVQNTPLADDQLHVETSGVYDPTEPSIE
jgi:hypothetical protein